jgi:hypothetical protein
VKKNWLNRLEFWRNRPVRFSSDFISLKPKKPNRTEPKQKKTGKKTKQNRKKPSKTELNQKNRAKSSQNWAKPKKPSQTRKNQAKPVRTCFCSKKIKPNRNRSVWTGFGFFFKFSLVAFFYIKTKPNRK